MSNAQHREWTGELPRLEEINSVYFVGIGGIGMSALARYFNRINVQVSGYDRYPSELTKELEGEGINIHYEEDIHAIPKDADLVVYTPAVPAEHAELVYYRQNNYTVVKRSDVLSMITKGKFNICIAGTHGKTTITTMVAHILRHSGHGATAFLGGLSVNYNSNFWSSENDVCVVEADEYDRSFLKLDPDIAVISAMDADHLDIYGTEENMQDAFISFGNRIKEGGLLISKFGLRRTREIKTGQKWSYSLQNDAADVFATQIKMEEGTYRFNVQLPGAVIENIRLNIGGMHNVENAVAAISVAHYLQIAPEKIREAVNDFKGVRRRFEYVLPPLKQEKGGYVYPVLIDDYAHHPEELKALLQSAKSLFPQRRITIIFQPHLYTRTRDLAEGFASTLSLAERVILLPIYPAREEPIEGVSSEVILEKVGAENKHLFSKDQMLEWMESHVKVMDKEFGEVIIMAGAGDIDQLVKPVKSILNKA